MFDDSAGPSNVQKWQQEILDFFVRLLTSRCGDPQAPASSFAALGQIHRQREDIEQAIGYFREALIRDFGQVEYHLALARLLAQTGQSAEAMHEATVCLRLRPHFGPAQTLIENLSARVPAVLSQDTTDGVGEDSR